MEKDTKYTGMVEGSEGRTVFARTVAMIGVAVWLFAACSSSPPPDDPPPEPEPEPEPTTRLIDLVERGDRRSIDELFGLQVEIDEIDAAGRSALHTAAGQGDHYVAQVLLERGADPNLQDTAGQTPFHMAVAGSHAEVVSLLVQYRAELFPADRGGRTPLDGLIAAPRRVYAAGLVPGNVAQRDNRGNEPLHHAARAGAVEVTEHLLDVGANPTARNEQRETALDLALEHPDSLDHMLIAEQLVLNDSPAPGNARFTFFARTVASRDWDARFSNNDTALHMAARSGYDGIVRLLLQRTVEIDAVNRAEQTALHLAIHNSRHGIVEELLLAGADPTKQDRNDNGVFFYALDGPRPAESLRFLLDRDVPPDSRNANGNTAIHIVLQKGLDTELVELLLEHDADPNLRNTAGKSPLLVAMEQGNRPAAELLIARESNIFAADNQGVSPASVAIAQGADTLQWLVDATGTRARDESGNNLLHYAASANRPEEVRYLIDRGVAVQDRNRKGDTPLHVAVQQESPLAARALIAADANLFASNNENQSPISIAFTRDEEWWGRFFVPEVLALRDGNGNTLLHYAVNEQDPRAVEGLLEYGVEVEARNRNGSSALQRAVVLRQAEIASLLLAGGADATTRDNRGNSPLHLVNGTAGPRIADMLLAAGAPIDARNNDGRTALYEAARRSDIAVVRSLAYRGADINVPDNRGRTALFDVVESGQLPLVEELVRAGASIQARDLEGFTPLHLAVAEQRLELSALARSHGADIFAENAQRQTVVELAFTRGIPMMETLVSRDTIDEQNNQGNTVLHLALLRDAPGEILEYLLAMDPDVSIRNANGKRPIDIAEERGNEMQIRLLRESMGD